MAEHVAIAGATGQLGRLVARELVSRGYEVTALVRKRSDHLAAGIKQVEGDLRSGYPVEALGGVSCLVSCAGAPRNLDAREPRNTYDSIDWEGHERLIETAQQAGVERAVYVSLINAHLFISSEYARAHEKTVGALRQSRMMESIIRPTAFFSSMFPLVDAARNSGRVTLIGDGSARVNPIADEDLAQVVADAVRDQPREVTVGGPEIFTRDQIAAMACEVAGVEPRVRHTPTWIASLRAKFASPFRPRLAAALRFEALIGEVDWLGPENGQRTLRPALEAYALESAVR